jgi:uncharacterized protein YfaT (DUF1175 family)
MHFVAASVRATSSGDLLLLDLGETRHYLAEISHYFFRRFS